VLENFLEALYHKVIVSIVIKRSSCDIYIELCSKTAVVDSELKTFETTSLNEGMLEFISSYTKESPYSYISVLDMSPDQGAIPTCVKSKLSFYEDLSSSEYKCFNKNWTYFTSKSSLNEIEKSFKLIGVDFIFSPFTLLYKFFEDKVSSSLSLYILVQDSYLSLSVFENSQLIFAEHLDMKMSTDDDLSGIEDLDLFEEIDEFSESQDIEEEFHEAEKPMIESGGDSNNEDYQRFSLIQSSLGHFYEDKRYDGAFVENVYIADGVGVSNDLKYYLEEEMFLNVYIKHLDIPMEVCSLAKEEIGL
jgi:hypothetical protein